MSTTLIRKLRLITGLVLFVFASVWMPRAMVVAFRGGIGRRNLYTSQRSEILRMEFEAVRESTGMASTISG